jgi:hypothetical protein
VEDLDTRGLGKEKEFSYGRNLDYEFLEKGALETKENTFSASNKF